MQHMRATGDAQCAPFAPLRRSLARWPDGLDCCTDRHACSKRDDVWPSSLFARSFSVMRRSTLSMSSSFANGLGRSYSITSSAQASGIGGASKPSVLRCFIFGRPQAPCLEVVHVEEGYPAILGARPSSAPLAALPYSVRRRRCARSPLALLEGPAPRPARCAASAAISRVRPDNRRRASAPPCARNHRGGSRRCRLG